MPCVEADLRPAPGAPTLAGRRVLAFAGIGRPDKLFATLEAVGAELVGRKAFPDHHPYRRAEIERLLERAAREEALCVTTSKDADPLAGRRCAPELPCCRSPWSGGNRAALERVLEPALAITADHHVMKELLIYLFLKHC